MTTTEIIIKLETLKEAADSAITDLENAASYLDIADPLSASEKRAVEASLTEAAHQLLGHHMDVAEVNISILELSSEVRKRADDADDGPRGNA